MSKLETSDLIQAMKLFSGDRYFAVSVFACDLSHSALSAIVASPTLTEDAVDYVFTVSVENGSVRMERAMDDVSPMPAMHLPDAVDKSAKDRIAAVIPVLGLMIGRTKDRVFTLWFDPVSRSWAAYSGGLVKWMKLRLFDDRGRLERERVAEEPYNLAAAFDDRVLWSLATFGPANRYKGVVAHIRKELCEIEENPADLEEWIDVVILAMDGAWRAAGADGAAFVTALRAKDLKNRLRKWPDWRHVAIDDSFEHVRSNEPPVSAASCDDSSKKGHKP